MQKKSKEKLIPDRYISTKGSCIENIDGRDYLIANDVMYTFYRRTKGEFSAFFLALRDDKRLLGASAPSAALLGPPVSHPLP